MAKNRIAGTIDVRVDGDTIPVAGDGWTWNIGHPKREPIMGPNGPVGFQEMGQASYIEGAAANVAAIDLDRLLLAEDVTVVVTAPNGDVLTFFEATQTGEGAESSGDGTVQLRFDAMSAKRVRVTS